MPRSRALILDTPAVIAYSQGSPLVGRELTTVADRKEVAVVPALCLAAAYQQVSTDRWDLLDVLTDLPQVAVTPLEHDMCAVLGGWARTLGPDLAHATMESAAIPPTPIITDRRKVITNLLPKEWPIIDL